MTQESSQAERLEILDIMRGLAALAVCAGHARAFLFVDWIDARSVTSWDRLFYFVTGIGHQAVMIFFVLSGFFIGGAVASTWSQGRWSFRKYALRRITRLEVVLVPALALTAFWDVLGGWATQGKGYDGSLYALLASGPQSGAPPDYGWSTILGNLTFLQTICVPAYGTNGPVWSLANEFWYYVLFPLLWIALFGRAQIRALSAVAAFAIIYWLPSQIVASGLIWLFGFFAWWLSKQSYASRILGKPSLLFALALLCIGTLMASKTKHWTGSDYSIGAVTALLVAAVACRRKRQARMPLAFQVLADMSYTLYLVHFPFLSFIWFVGLAPHQFQPSLTGYGIFAGVVGLAIVYAYIVWWCFERNTIAFRTWAEKNLR